MCTFFRFSVSNDLKYDAERDLRDIGAKNIQVHSLNKVRLTTNEGRNMVMLAHKTILITTLFPPSSNMEKSHRNTMEV